MGIVNFFKVTVNPATDKNRIMIDLGEDINLKDLAGQTLAFDASGMIYAAILALRDVKGMTDKDGKITSHIKTILQQVLMFKKHNIKQIWVFDNKETNPLKAPTLEKRKEKRDNANGNEKIEFKMTSEHVEDIQKILQLLGILYITAPPGIEAEQYAAYLTIPKPDVGAMCQYVYSNDADVLVFGGNLLRPMKVATQSGKSKKKIYKAFKIQTVLDQTALTREQLAAMATALGCDFAKDKTKGIGPKTATNKARADDIQLTDEQRAARDYFLLDVSDLPIEISNTKPNHPELIEYLVSRNFNRENLEKILA